MKKLLILISLFLTFNNAFGKDSSNIKIAVMDMREISKNSLVAKSIQNKISQKEKEYQKIINKKREKLEKDYQEIINKTSILSANSLKKEENKFNKNFQKLQDELEEKRNSLDNAKSQALIEISAKIEKIVSQIRKEKSIDIVLSQINVISFDKKLDISNEVLKKLNKEMKTIKLDFN